MPGSVAAYASARSSAVGPALGNRPLSQGADEHDDDSRDHDGDATSFLPESVCRFGHVAPPYRVHLAVCRSGQPVITV